MQAESLTEGNFVKCWWPGAIYLEAYSLAVQILRISISEEL